MGYRPDIDGLRAVAVLAVLFYHAHLGFPGGYVGVDVFFVLSGFLITGLLLKAIRAGTFSFLDFWERRVRRLAPALMVLTAFVALSAPLVLLPEDLTDLGGALIAQPLLLSNVYFWRVVQGGYFGDAPEIRPLLHTWSLGVEEQFYLFFPIALALLHRHFPRRVGLGLSGIFLASLTLGVAWTPVRESFSFFNLPTRAWELLMGGILAWWLQGTRAPLAENLRARQVLAWIGLGMVGWSIFFYRPDTPFPGSAALLPCLGTALLLLANSAGPLTWVGRVLSHPAAVRMGQISYSLYLWHWPLVAYAFYLGVGGSLEARWLLVLASCLAGYASWRWVETPIRSKRILPRRRAMGWLFASYAVLAISSGQLFLQSQGYPENWAEKARPREFRSRTHAVDPLSDEARPTPMGSPRSEGPRFLLWGDSHAMSLAPLLHELGRSHDLPGLQLTATSSAPLLDWGHEMPSWDKSPEYKKRWRELALKTLEQERAGTVFLSGYWSSYTREGFAQDLRQTVRHLQGRGIRVVFVGDFPSQPGVNSRNLRLVSRWPWLAPHPATPEDHRAQNAKVHQALEGLPRSEDFVVLDPGPEILGWQGLTRDAAPLYIDSHHLSDEGALLLKSLFEPVFRQMQDGR